MQAKRIIDAIYAATVVHLIDYFFIYLVFVCVCVCVWLPVVIKIDRFVRFGWQLIAMGREYWTVSQIRVIIPVSFTQPAGRISPAPDHKITCRD